MTQRWFALALTACIGIAGCGGSGPAGGGPAPPPPPPPPPTAPPAGAAVVFDIIDDFFVDPDGNRNSNARVTITLGETVGWTHNGGNDHTVSSTAVPGGAMVFDSGTLRRGDTFTVTPGVAGVYIFRCNVHPTTMLDVTITVNAP